MKALILAAGESAKLSPFTSTRPKSMIFLSGEYILQTLLRQLSDAGIKEVAIVIGHQKEMIREHFHFGKSLGLTIEYITQDQETGIGSAVLLAEDYLKEEENFLLVYGDALVEGNCFNSLLEHYHKTKPKALATITHPLSEGSYGNVYLGHEMRISKFIEKPEGRLSNYIFAGSFILGNEIFASLKKNQGNMVELYQGLIANQQMEASLWEDLWIDISRPWHILSANNMMMRHWNESIIPASVEIEADVNIKGVVHMGENVKISSGAIIVGPCYIGDNVYIGNSTLIRDHSSIGPNSVIGFGTEIKNSVLFGGAIVGRLSFIGDSVLGKNVYIGSGSMTINTTCERDPISIQQEESIIPTGQKKLGAFIGDNSHIGAGHTIAPGTVIPANHTESDRFTLS